MTAPCSPSSQVQKYCLESALLCIFSASMQENVSGSETHTKDDRTTHVNRNQLELILVFMM